MNKGKLKFLLMCLYMFEQKSQSMDTQEDFRSDRTGLLSSQNNESNKKIWSLKGLLLLSSIVVFVTAFTNFFIDNKKTGIAADIITNYCSDMPFAVDPTHTTSNCGVFMCTTDPTKVTTNCGDLNDICTSNPLIITTSCPSCTQDPTKMTTNCASVFTYNCNNRTDVFTTNCGTSTPVICNASPFVTTTNCSSTASCTNDITKTTTNCGSINYSKNPNQNTTFCSNTTLSPNVCNINPNATSDNCPNAAVKVDPMGCVRDSNEDCITTDDGTCGNVVSPIKVVKATIIEATCLSYTSIAMNRLLAAGHNCPWWVGVNPNAITCGDCFESGTDFMKANNPYPECSGFTEQQNVIYMQYDENKASNSLNSGRTCNTAATGATNTCGTCYGYSGATQKEVTTNVFPECAYTPYDSKKANVVINTGTCTTSVSGALTATTCGDCYGNAVLQEQTQNVLSQCGITTYDDTLSMISIPFIGGRSTCPTSVSSSISAANCGACYSTANRLEKTTNVLQMCSKASTSNEIDSINSDYLTKIPLFANPTPVLGLKNIPCTQCPSIQSIYTDGWVGNIDPKCTADQTDSCSCYTPYRANNSLNYGDCPFNAYATTCAQCYVQSNVTDFQRAYNVIDKCNWEAGGWILNCGSCPIYKYSNLTNIWDPVCVQNIIPCSNCNNWLNKPECTIRDSMPCSQCGSCSNGTTSNVPAECLTPKSIPCNTCTDTLKQDKSNIFSKQCAYKPSIPCSDCDICSSANPGDTINIPPECRKSNLAPCTTCSSCNTSPNTAAPECQTNTTISCLTCCGGGVTATTAPECKIKPQVSCSNCDACINGDNIPSECVQNITVQCTKCNSCTSGSFIPPECAVKPSVACSSCPSCMSGTNIPSECSVPKSISCGSCSNAVNLTECLSNTTHIPTSCGTCPSASSIYECIKTTNTEEVSGFIGNLILGAFGITSAVYLLNQTTIGFKITSGVYSAASIILGVLMLIGINENIEGLAEISGNNALTISGNILGSANIVSGLVNGVIMALVKKINKNPLLS